MSTSISSFTVPELLSLIKSSSFQRNGRNAAEEAERILIRREEELRNQVIDLTKKVVFVKNERDSIKMLHGLAEAEKMSMEGRLKKTEVECKELSVLLDKALNQNQSLAYNIQKAQDTENVKKAEALGMKRKISEFEGAKMAQAERIETMEAELKRKINELDEVKKAEALGMNTVVELNRKINQLEEAKRAQAERMDTMEAELRKKITQLDDSKKAEALRMKTVVELKREINQLEEANRAKAERMETMDAELKNKITQLDEAKKAEALGLKIIKEAKRAEDERMEIMEAELKKKISELDEAKKAEALRMETIAELEKMNKKLEKAIMQDRDVLKQRISDIEEIVPCLFGRDVTVARQIGHDDLNSCRDLRSSSDSGGDHSSHRQCLRSSSGSGGNHTSHRQKQDPVADNCDVDVCKKEPVDVCKKEPVVGSPVAVAEGPNTPNDIIEIIDSDDEATADESAVRAKTGERNCNMDSSCEFVCGRKRERSISSSDEANLSVISWEKAQDKGEIFHDDQSLFSNGINLESTFKEMSSVNKKMRFVNTEDKIGLNQSFNPVHCGKTALISGDEANRLGLCSQKTKNVMEIFDVDNNVLIDSKSMALDIEGNVSSKKRNLEMNDLHELDGNHSSDQSSFRNHTLTDTVASDCNSSDSDDGFTADSDIDSTIKKLRIVKSAEDLASKCKKNYELCMKAVCALYRKTVADENLATDTSIASPGLFHFNRMGGKELAELLTNGDRKHRLMRSVADLEPEALKKCRELALCYNMKLLEIYRKGEDPFFCCICL